MSIPYSPLDERLFYIEVKKWVKLGEPLSLFPGAVKIRRKDTNAPFSVLFLTNPFTGAQQIYIISNMRIGIPGAFGGVKVAYPLTPLPRMHGQAPQIEIDFANPVALKIVTHSDLETGDEANIITPAAKMHYAKTGGYYQTIRDSTSEKITKPWSKKKFYYVMPLHKGDELFSYLENNCVKEPNKLTAKLFLVLAYKIALAIKALHDKNLVHRDLKPENIIIQQQKIVEDIGHKILDLGPATKISIKIIDKDNMLPDGCVAKGHGTPSYTAPELFSNPENFKIFNQLTASSASPKVLQDARDDLTETERRISKTNDIFSYAMILNIIYSELVSQTPYVFGKLTPLLTEIKNPNPAARPTIDAIILALENIIKMAGIAMPPGAQYASVLEERPTINFPYKLLEAQPVEVAAEAAASAAAAATGSRKHDISPPTLPRSKIVASNERRPPPPPPPRSPPQRHQPPASQLSPRKVPAKEVWLNRQTIL